MRARGSRMEADPSLLLTHVSNQPRATEWLNLQVALRRTPNTVAAYGRGLDDYLSFCSRTGIDPERASRSDIATYVHELAVRPPAAAMTKLMNGLRDVVTPDGRTPAEIAVSLRGDAAPPAKKQ